MLDQWVQATLEWEDTRSTEVLGANLWHTVLEVEQISGERWPAEYVGWTLAELLSYKPAANGHTNGTQGAIK